MTLRTSMLSLFLLGLTGCSGSCGDEAPTPKAEAEQKAVPVVAAPAAPLVPTVTADAMQAFAPDKIDSLTASSAAKTKVIDLPAGAHMIVLRRAYGDDKASVQLEMMDTVQAPTTRAIFTKALTLTRETSDAVMKPVEIQGHKGLAQWNKATATARIGVLIADRFLVNASIKPADNVDRAIELANKLDFTGLAKLTTTPATP